MHDFSTRAGTNSRQNSAIFASVLAAFLCLASPAAEAAANDTGTRVANPAVQNNTAHEIAIEIVKPGSEGLELTARLSQTSGLIERDITWVLRDAQGAVVYEGKSRSPTSQRPPATTPLKPPMARPGFRKASPCCRPIS
jgi:hypothetical protein